MVSITAKVLLVGAIVGLPGTGVGRKDGLAVGKNVGSWDGLRVGVTVGSGVGLSVGTVVGVKDG